MPFHNYDIQEIQTDFCMYLSPCICTGCYMSGMSSITA